MAGAISTGPRVSPCQPDRMWHDTGGPLAHGQLICGVITELPVTPGLGTPRTVSGEVTVRRRHRPLTLGGKTRVRRSAGKVAAN